MKIKYKILAIVLLMATFSVYLAVGQNDNMDKYFDDRLEVYFSFNLEPSDDISEISKLVSISSYDMLSGDVTAYANRKELKEFMKLGIDFRKLTPPSMLRSDIKMVSSLEEMKLYDWEAYPTYEAYIDMMNQFATDFPNICQIENIGYTNGERELIAVKISDNVSSNESEPQFFYTSTMHGDETAGYVLLLRLIDYLLNNYGTNPRITELVDGIEIYINPNANPDGSYAAGNNNIYGATRYNALGIDINRNFPDPDDGPHPDGNPWQTETIAFMNFAEDHHFVMSANIHGGEEVCNYPWDTWWFVSADDDWWQYVCHEYADTAHANSPAGYMNGFNNGITNGYAWYTISGGRQDYMNYFHQCREFCLEISAQKLLPPSQLPAWWDYNHRSLLNYLEQVSFGVRGTVTDKDSGDPLYAEVFVLNHEVDSSWVYSNATNGNYHRMLNEGTYDIKYSSVGYYPKTLQDVSVVNRQATILDVELESMLSVVDNYQENPVQIFPNPVSSTYFQLNIKKAVNFIKIFDASGKLVYEAGNLKTGRYFINASEWEPGMYIIQILENNNVFSSKLQLL